MPDFFDFHLLMTSLEDIKIQKNDEYWKVGCLGITQPCSKECETAFIACVESLDVSSDLAFEDCIEMPGFTTLVGCTEDCAPTYKMLEASETPTTSEFRKFGAGEETAGQRPNASLCIIPEIF